MNQTPEFNVSVIVPVYNASLYVERAVESVILIKDVKELLLIDDGSTDNSLEICKKLQNKYSIIRLFQHPKGVNLGAAASRNLGIENAKCNYISFLDADDYYLPNRFDFEKGLFLAHPDADGVYGCNREVFENKRAKELYFEKRSTELTSITQKVPPEKLYRFLLFGGYGEFHTSTITLKKHAFQRAGIFNTNIRYVEDTELWLKLSVVCRLYTGSIKEPQSVRIVHETNSIHDWDKITPYKDIMYQSVFDWILKQHVAFNIKNDFFTSLYYHFRGRYKNTASFIFNQILRNPSIVFSSFLYKKIFMLLKS